MTSLGNKKIMSKNLHYYVAKSEKERNEICRDLDVAYSTFTDWYNGNTYPRIDRIEQMARYFGCTKADLVEDRDHEKNTEYYSDGAVSIPVYDRVAAGFPLAAIEDVVDREEIPRALASTGEFFGLRIKGNSMEPKFSTGDVVIVRKQDDADDGDVVIAIVNGNDAVCKRLKKYQDGIALLSDNPAFAPMYFSLSDTQDIPVRIIGRVMELRAKL